MSLTIVVCRFNEEWRAQDQEESEREMEGKKYDPTMFACPLVNCMDRMSLFYVCECVCVCVSLSVCVCLYVYVYGPLLKKEEKRRSIKSGARYMVASGREMR